MDQPSGFALQTDSHQEALEDTSGSHRALVLSGATLGQMIGLTPAVHSVFGLTLIPLSHQFGWSRSSMSAGLALLSMICMFGYPIAGRYADRHGAWRVAMCGIVVFGAALAAGSLLTGSIWQFYALYLALAVGATMVNPTLYLKMVSETHARDFGFAAGFSGGIGVGGGYSLVTLAASAVMTHFGWRDTYLGVAAFVLAVGFTAQLVFLRSVGAPPTPTPTPTPTTSETRAETMAQTTPAQTPNKSRLSHLRRPDFWLIFAGLALMGGLMMGVFGHVIPILAEHGVSSSMAAEAFALCNLVLLPWQPICGFLVDRYGPRIITVPYLMTAVGLVLLAVATNWLLIVSACIAFGVGVGTQFCTIPFMVQRHFGLRTFSNVMGLLYMGLFLGQAIGPVALDMVFDSTGSYQLALAGFFLLTIVGGVMVWVLAARTPDGSHIHL
jgi:MFS family permease